MLDLSEGSPELVEVGGVFKRESWRDCEDRLVENSHSSPTLQPFGRCELHALSFYGDSALCFLVEDELLEFQLHSNEGALQFPPMGAFHRRIVSDCALRHGLEPMSLGTGKERYMVVMKTERAKAVPMITYADAMPTSMPLEKLHAAVGYKRRKSDDASVEFAAIAGQLMACKNLNGCENYRPYLAQEQETDRSDWSRLVALSLRRGIPIATHSHIVEVRIPQPTDEASAELKRFLGPFPVRWLGGEESTGVGVVVYPSVPAANNCLDRYEHEDDPGVDGARAHLPFRLYPFAPHVFGAFIDEARRYQGGASTPNLSCSPSSVGGSWRDGGSLMDRHVGGGSRWSGATPPLVPKDPSSGSSPPLHGKAAPWSGRGAPKGLSPTAAPYRSPGAAAAAPGRNSPDLQPLSLGKGRWLEVKTGSGQRHTAAEEAPVEKSMPAKAKMGISQT